MKSSRLLFLFFLAGLIGLLGISVFQLQKRYEIEKYKSAGIAVKLTEGKEKGSAAYTVLSFQEALVPGTAKKGIPLVEVKKGDNVREIKTGNRTVLFFENNIIFDPEAVKEGNFTVAFVEFIKPVGFDRIPKNKILTMHTIRDKELANYNEEETRYRYIRAVLERKISILYLKDPVYLNKLSEALKNRGVQLQAPGENPYQLKSIGIIKNIRFKQLLALLLALLMPLAGFFTARRLKTAWSQFAVITAFSLTAAVVISGYLSETIFMLRLEQFIGVKAALLLPPLVVFFLLVYENKALFTGKIIMTISGVLLFFIVIMVVSRSGNYSMPLLPFEKELRDWFERVLYARPRLKEFMIGHPALLFGLYIYNRARADKKKTVEMVPAVFLIALGMLGQTSIINTFCHVHSDLSLSVLRTVYGLIIGVLLGVMLILCRKIVKK